MGDSKERHRATIGFENDPHISFIGNVNEKEGTFNPYI